MEERGSFCIGDIVRIRDWEDMKKEFGVVGGMIPCRFSFTPRMRKLCGKQFIISGISISGGLVVGHGFDCAISIDMIESVCPYHKNSDDTSEIGNYLSEYKRKGA